MMPAKAPSWVGLKFKNCFVEIPITIVLFDVFEVNLRRYNDEHSEHQWDKKSRKPFPGKLRW